MRPTLLAILVVLTLSLALWSRFGVSPAVAVYPPTTFSDTQHGFSLVFPPSWHGVQTLPVSTEQYDYVAFTHPLRVGDAGREGKLEFSVFVLDRDEEQAPEGAVVLAERNGTRYAWLMTEAKLPPSLRQAASDVSGIMSTFVTSSR